MLHIRIEHLCRHGSRLEHDKSPEHFTSICAGYTDRRNFSRLPLYIKIDCPGCVEISLADVSDLPGKRRKLGKKFPVDGNCLIGLMAEFSNLPRELDIMTIPIPATE